MSGVTVIRYLLAHDSPVLAVAAADNIAAGDLPLRATLPGIAVAQVSSVPRLTVSMGDRMQHTDRVQVSVLVKGTDASPAGTGYPGVKRLLKLVLAACPNKHGSVNGIDVDFILPDSEGPDFHDSELALHSGSRDFIVRWNE